MPQAHPKDRTDRLAGLPGPCRVKRCHSPRYAVSSFCLHHRNRVGYAGHPTITPPRAPFRRRLIKHIQAALRMRLAKGDQAPGSAAGAAPGSAQAPPSDPLPASGDVLGLIETVDQLLSQFEGSLWAFAIEQPEIPKEFRDGYRKLANMVVKAADELGLGGRAFFRSPHDVPAYNHKVMLYEKEADVISTSLKQDIFNSDLDLARKLHLREFVEQIDEVADIAEDVADRLAIYAIKRLV